MEMDRGELQEELVHQQQMVRDLRRRRRVLQRQLAHQGYQALPQIVIEVEDITAQIKTFEDEIANLRTLAAVDKEPLAEVEYRAAVAEAWAMPDGQITVV